MPKCNYTDNSTSDLIARRATIKKNLSLKAAQVASPAHRTCRHVSFESSAPTRLVDPQIECRSIANGVACSCDAIIQANEELGFSTDPNVACIATYYGPSVTYETAPNHRIFTATPDLPGTIFVGKPGYPSPLVTCDGLFKSGKHQCATLPYENSGNDDFGRSAALH